MNSRLLATKFHIPSLRPEAVPRTSTLERLQQGVRESHKLTLVSAPAGYGKTTLVTGWFHALQNENLQTAWLTLEENDNDTARFLNYWLAAFQQVEENLNGKIQPLLDRPQLPPVDILLDELLNELAEGESTILLALDDYHVITNPQVHEMLAYFIDHQPARVHLVIITREDPPLPLPRLRARGQMTEIRVHDLRFTIDEARQFFRHSLNRPLDEKILQILEERTEGWAVGLQLAGLALQNLKDPRHFIETFSGSHRYVLDYLAEEVIRQQGAKIYAFLTKTSILDRFNASVCSAVTGQTDSQAVIDHLDQANLFVVPLDNERTWYRYHPLFSEYLRTQLSRQEILELNKKASAWHEANGLMIEAVKYALASDDTDFATDVIERALINNSTWSSGNMDLLSSWLDALPPHAIQNRPQLTLDASRVLYTSGRFEPAEKFLEQAEHSLRSLSTSPEVEEMLTLAALYRGSIASVRGEVHKAIEQITFARARLPRENHMAHARAYFSLGQAYKFSGQTEQAVENYLLSAEVARSTGVLYLVVHARCAAAQVMMTQGRLRMAEQNCQESIQLAEGERIPLIGLAWSILGSIAMERNDLAAAEKHLQDGIGLSRQFNLMDDITWGLIYLSRLHAVRGNSEQALKAVQEINAIVQAYGVERMSTLGAAHVARVQYLAGHKQAAAQWAAAYEQSTRPQYLREFEDLTLARILLANGELDRIPVLLNPLLEKANAAGRIQTCIETLILLALFHHARKETQTALECLGKSLQLAAPEGYALIFLTEDEKLLELLPKARAYAPGFVDMLLDERQTEHETRAPLLEQLPDPLSEQELRVLGLIVEGMSNQEIADELVISVGTAKWHVHNIYQKLGVSSRSQAIARARELGL